MLLEQPAGLDILAQKDEEDELDLVDILEQPEQLELLELLELMDYRLDHRDLLAGLDL